MVSHGLNDCARVYSIPDGAKYLVIQRAGDFRAKELLQELRGLAVQVVVEDDCEQVYVWWPSTITQEFDTCQKCGVVQPCSVHPK